MDFSKYVVKTGPAVVVRSGLALPRFLTNLRTFIDNVSVNWRLSVFFGSYTLYKTITEKKHLIWTHTATFIHNPWATGYYHWILDALTKLMVLEKTVGYSRLTLLIPDNYPRFAFESLALLAPELKILHLPENTGAIVRNLLLVRLSPRIVLTPEFMDIFRKWLFEKLNMPFPYLSQFQRIYVSRAHDKIRRILYEDKLIKFLTIHGFKTIHAENLSFKQQILLFSACEVLLGVHGAGLTNMIWMPSERGITIEISVPPHPHKGDTNRCFEQLASCLGITHCFVWADKWQERPGLHWHRSDLYVTPELVNRLECLFKKLKLK